MRLLKTKILVTGATGLLGSTLLRQLHDTYTLFGISRNACPPEERIDGVEYIEADITSKKQVTDIVRSVHPKYVLNTAAFTDVDGSEEAREACWKTNVEAVSYLAHATRLSEARLVHVSSDYVFDGTSGPYKESDRPNPLGYYGKSKLAGENALMASGADYAIARTMVLYGRPAAGKTSFVNWVVQQLRAGNSIRIVDDQFGNPTLADDLAKALVELAASKKQATYHISGSEVIDRYHFALEIASVFGLDAAKIARIKTADLGQAAPRPLASGFDISLARTELGIHMSDARGGLELFRELYGG